MSLYHYEGKVQITSCNDFKQYIQTCKHYKPSPIAIQAITSYIEQYHIIDNDFKCIENDIISYSNYLIGKEGSNENSSIIFQQCNHNKSIIINLCIHIECFPYYKSNDFHLSFLTFTANTFSIFTVIERKLCFEYIVDQFESIEQVIDDLDGYARTDNMSAIMDEMDIEDSSKAGLFVKELKKCIESTLVTINEKEISLYDEIESKQIALSMFKLWNIWLNPDDECIQQITNLFQYITPKNYITLRDIFTQNIMKQYLKFPNRNCLAMIAKKMNEFVATEYAMNDYCDIGQIINKKLLPYIPILTHLMSDNKLNGEDIKLTQMLFIVSIIRGIPNIMNIFNNNDNNDDDNNNSINLDVALVFNKDIVKGIKKAVINKGNNGFVIKRKKIKQNNYFKETNYYNIDNVYDHLFKDIIKSLIQLHENSKLHSDLIRLYIDMSQDSSHIYYPQVIVEITKNNKFVCDHQTAIHSVLTARKRYEADLELIHEIVTNLKNSKELDYNVIAESEYMVLSNIIDSNKGDITNCMYLQYALGIIRFMNDDIYNILPTFFDHGTMDKCHFLGKVGNDDMIRFQDKVYNDISGKFNKYQTSMQ